MPTGGGPPGIMSVPDRLVDPSTIRVSAEEIRAKEEEDAAMADRRADLAKQKAEARRQRKAALARVPAWTEEDCAAAHKLAEWEPCTVPELPPALS